MKLRIAEIFTSIQGEGHLVGKRMRFIRFAGCGVFSCPLHPVNGNTCDTNWAGRESYDQAGMSELADDALCEVGPGGWVSITGGEPSDQFDAMNFLAGEIRGRGMQLNIQTAGTRIIPCPWDWLTVSPKASPAKTLQNFGQELKLVYTGQTIEELREWHQSTKFWNYYLMPHWGSPGPNTLETIEAIHSAHKAGMTWELTTQAHKQWGVR